MHMNEISLSINPLYLCNFKCPFCYLSTEQLNDKKIIDSNQLFNKLTEISKIRKISHIDLYGGEISLIPEPKFNEIISIIKIFYHDKINIVTNYYATPKYFEREDITLSVSWDYRGREKYLKVYENMLNANKSIHLLFLANLDIIHATKSEISNIISLLNALPKLSSVEIKPYSMSVFNMTTTNFRDHEDFVQRWIDQSKSMKFEFINLKKIQASLEKKYSSWSDNHLYITPKSELAVLDFDEREREYFKVVHSMDEYQNWFENEKQKHTNNSYCKNCKYLGHCLSEHLQEVKDLTNSCNGFFNLLEANQKRLSNVVLEN
jgi:MoaA/NifB/PqqE/SkfB family radical SAM enzyme